MLLQEKNIFVNRKVKDVSQNFCDDHSAVYSHDQITTLYTGSLGNIVYQQKEKKEYLLGAMLDIQDVSSRRTAETDSLYCYSCEGL